MRSLSQKGDGMRFVHPCLTSRENKVPNQDYRRVNGFQEPPRAVDAISSCQLPYEEKNDGGDAYTGLQSEYS